MPCYGWCITGIYVPGRIVLTTSWGTSLKRLAIVAAAMLVLSGCASEAPAPVSSRVAEYYEANKELKPIASRAAAPVVAFIGDSFSAGTGATVPERRWTTLLASSKGWVEKNYALGGTGYLNKAGREGCGKDECPNYLGVVPQVVAAKPDVVVVAGGLNDKWLTVERFDAAVAAVYDRLHTALPKAKIIAVEPVWTNAEAPPLLEEMKTVVQRRAKAEGAIVLDIGNPLAGRSDAVIPDGHPNDLGHSLIADATEKALKASGL